MNATQWQWLNKVAGVIPELFKPIEQGHDRVASTLGVRLINGKHVRLSLIAEVVDSGANPLRGHSSENVPEHTGEIPANMATPKPRHRKRAKRW